jgi:hypothetical protein
VFLSPQNRASSGQGWTRETEGTGDVVKTQSQQSKRGGPHAWCFDESVKTLHSHTLILCTITEISAAGDSPKEMSAHVAQRTTQVTATTNNIFFSQTTAVVVYTNKANLYHLYIFVT